MSTPNDTLRARLEAIRVALTLGEHLRADQHAVAALRILDEADTAYGNEKRSPHPYWRLVWDADGIVPDPGGRAAPPPTTTTTP